MLNCYYAHGDEKGDSRLQRRCYWLLEADEDIVLVHYLNTAMVRPVVSAPDMPGVRA